MITEIKGNVNSIDGYASNNKIIAGVLKGYGGFLSIGCYYSFQLRSKADGSEFQYRQHDGTNWGNWKAV